MIERWARERPDLDASSLGIIARLTRLARAIDEDAAAALHEYHLTDVEFQLLAAIRTAPDCRAAPRTLLQPLMVTSGGLTNRIDRLESAGLVVRAPNPDDRRGVFLELTREGRELIDQSDRGLSAEPGRVAPRGALRTRADTAGPAAAQTARFVVGAQYQTPPAPERTGGPRRVVDRSGRRSPGNAEPRSVPAPGTCRGCRPVACAPYSYESDTTTSRVSPSRRIVTVTSSPGRYLSRTARNSPCDPIGSPSTA